MKIEITGIYDNKYRFEISRSIYFHGVDELKKYLESKNIKITDLEFIGLNELKEEHSKLLNLIGKKQNEKTN